MESCYSCPPSTNKIGSCIGRFSESFWFYILIFIILILLATFSLIYQTFEQLWLGIFLYVIFIIGCILFALGLSKINFDTSLGLLFIFIFIFTAIFIYANSLNDGKSATLILLLIVLILTCIFIVFTNAYPVLFLTWGLLFYICRSLDT